MSASLALLRVYLCRGAGRRSWFKKSLARQLVEDAFRSGIEYASITSGHCGYVSGARRISDGSEEMSFESLPQCVELAASRSALEVFVKSHEEVIRDCVVVWFEGSQVTAP
jgi:PII-like signaling protein